MHIPQSVKQVLRRTPLYAFYARSRRNFAEWRRTLRGLPPAPPPLPPTPLVVAVAGNTDPEWFLRSGLMGAESITAILGRNGLDMTRMRAVLDFGCGVGRVLRYWATVKGPRIHGTDYNAELIAWCRENLRFAKFNVNALTGRLPYRSGTFDFIYALSVFTHLTGDQQDFWMEELSRILTPAGHLLISTHGDYYVQHLSAADQATYRAGGLVVVSGQEAGTNVCAAYHPPAYVRAHLGSGFDVVEFAPEGAKGNPAQDYWLLRRKPADRRPS